MTERQFLELSKKYLEGNCTEEEIALLRDYTDHIRLLDEDSAEVTLPDEEKTYREIRGRLNRSVSRRGKPVIRLPYWLKVAAVVLVVLSTGILFYTRKSQPVLPDAALSRINTQAIRPGGNNAYLTLSDGSLIPLDAAGKKQLSGDQNIKAGKADSGLLIYAAASPGDTGPAPRYNTITTPAGGQYQVILSDGTKVWLNAVSSIRFPVAFNQQQRKVEITGEAYFEVAKNEKVPFLVSANGVEVNVLGTHFNVSAYADDPSIITTLLEGAVMLKKGAQSALLSPGQQGIATSHQSGFEVSRVNADKAIAWKNGLFIFHDENITEVMKKIARWYNVEVEYRGDVKHKKLGGTISRYEDITEFLEVMKLTGGIDYKIEERKIIILIQ